MAAIDDPKTFGRARLSFADQHDIDEFLATLEKFERGEIGPDQWRKFRLVRRWCRQDAQTCHYRVGRSNWQVRAGERRHAISR